MNVFPIDPSPTYPLELTSEWRTLKSNFESGKESRRQVWTFPKRSMRLRFEALYPSEVNALSAFHIQQKGALEPFYYFWPLQNPDGSWPSYTGEYVGKGDGSTTIFDLPSKSTTGVSVYVSSVLTSVTFLSGGGEGGVDRIQFSQAPAVGATITSNFTGQLRLRVRFKDDALKKDLNSYGCYGMEFELAEVRF